MSCFKKFHCCCSVPDFYACPFPSSPHPTHFASKTLRAGRTCAACSYQRSICGKTQFHLKCASRWFVRNIICPFIKHHVRMTHKQQREHSESNIIVSLLFSASCTALCDSDVLLYCVFLI